MPEGAGPARGAGGKAACVRYTPELGREICARVAAGESQHALAREPGMPSRRTFRDWALREPEFGAAFEAAKLAGRARQIAADREADLRPGTGKLWRTMMAQASPGRRRVDQRWEAGRSPPRTAGLTALRRAPSPLPPAV